MYRKFLILPFLMWSMSLMAEKSLTVESLSGQDKQFAVSLIGQIKFDNRVMYLYDKSHTELGHTAVSDISTITFKEGQQTSISETAVSSVNIYPNPTQDALVINGLRDVQTVRVYDLQGKLLLSVQAQSDNTEVNVSNLPQGDYLLQVGAEIVKFIKQ